MNRHVKCIAFYLLVNTGLQVNAQNFPSDHQQLKKEIALLKDIVEKNHVASRPIDDAFSVDVFDQLVTFLDPRSIVFTKSDLDELGKLKLQIDEDIQGKSWVFFPTLVVKYKQCLESTKRISEELLQKSLNLNENAFFIPSEFGPMKAATSHAAFVSKRKIWLKYQLLNRMSNAFRTQTTLGGDWTSLEKEAREKVLLSEQRRISRILEHPMGYEVYMGSIFLNALLYCHDPHSYYMTPTDYENMKASLSKDALTFGMDLDEDEYGNIVIERLQPGGPAWRSNQLHKGDQLVKLKWEGKPELYLEGADMEEVMDILSKSNTSKMEFTVRKSSGIEIQVVLAKEKLAEGHSMVRSFVLKGEKKVGYISLPGFYSEWENTGKLGCANDVAKEIIKLKKEGIEGLVLDMRFNGGGSLGEGIELAGIFINEGVLAMLVPNDKRPVLLKDPNRGTLYDGPLVVMVNKQSASASELVASTLQDYNRAIIVGSQTFGKGTGQKVMCVDTSYNEAIPNQKNKKPTMGFAAVTFFKLYKSTGKSVQKRGLRPDIVLPDVFDWVPFGEEYFPFALANDSINKKIYAQKYPALPASSLMANSEKRIKQQKAFAMVKGEDPTAGGPPFLQKDTIPLMYTKYIKKMEGYTSWWKQYLEAQKISKEVYAVEVTQDEQLVLGIDSYNKEISNVYLAKIKEDIYVKESFQIAKDLIDLSVK